MAVIRNISTQQVDEECPRCGKGYMRPTGITDTTVPPQHEHACTVCGHKQTYSIRYPHIVQ